MHLREIVFTLLTIGVFWVACKPNNGGGSDDDDVYTIDLTDLFKEEYDYYNDKVS